MYAKAGTVKTATRARTNLRGDKSTLRGGAGKGEGGTLKLADAFFILMETIEWLPNEVMLSVSHTFWFL